MVFAPRSARLILGVLALSLATLFVSPDRAAAQAPARKALINAETVVGAPSQEEEIATALGFAVTIVSDEVWAGYSAADFGQYDLLIAGDPSCGSLPPGLVSSAATYGPVVLGRAGGRTQAGNRIVVGTDPVLHDGHDHESPGARGTIIREGIAYAGIVPGRTGMYFGATCAANYYNQSAETLAILAAISSGTGTWTINDEPSCVSSVALIADHPAFVDLTTASLAGWSCSVHEAFPTFPLDWSALAVATDTDTKPTCGVDPDTGANACGEAYILIAGASIAVDSKVISVSPLESTNPAGTSHAVTANVHAVGGTPVVVGQLVDFSVTGQNAGANGVCIPADCRSDANGNVRFTYLGSQGPGDDTIKASFTDTAGSLQAATAQKHWLAGEGGSSGIAVTPTDATNPVGTSHTVRAHVQNDGVPLGGVTVTFTVTGRNVDATGTCVPAGCVTDSKGDVSFTYLGANGVGDDTIAASFTDNAGSLQRATAQKHWLAGEGGSSSIAFGDFAEDVEVHQGFDSHEDEFRTAYVAVEEAGVRILDVTDPDEIGTLGSYAPATCQNGRKTATFFADDVEFVEVESLSALFVAAGRCGVLVLDVSDPTDPILIGRYDTPEWAEAVQIDTSDDRVIGYIADHNGGLVIVDFTGLFQKPPTPAVRLGAIGSKAKGWGKGAAIDVAVHHTEGGVLVFVANSQGLRVVDATTPASPKLIGGYNTNPRARATPPSVPQDITLSEDGQTAFMAIWQAGLLAIDVSDPAHPALLRQIATSPGLAYNESEIAGDSVFATEGKGGLRRYARGESGLETISGEVPIPIADGNGWAWDVQVVDRVAYVTYAILEDGTGGLAVIRPVPSDLEP